MEKIYRLLLLLQNSFRFNFTILRISRIHSLFTTFLSAKGEPRQKTGLQFAERVASLASGLSSSLVGIKPGDVVAIWSLNTDFYLEWILAVAYVGAIVAPLNYRWSLEEAKSALQVLKPVMLLLDDHCAFWYYALQTYSLPSLRWHVSLSQSLNNVENIMTTDALLANFSTSSL